MDIQVILKAIPEILTQLLAFLVVLWILKKFAFKPILGMIDQRRKVIQDSFLDIDQKKRDLEDLEKDYRKKLENIEEAARAKIQEGSAAGLSLARDIQEKARLESQKLIDRARGEIDRDLAQARLQIRDEVVELSSLMTEKIIQQKLNDAEHKKLVEQFIKEMEKVS